MPNYVVHDGKCTGTKNFSKDGFQYYRTRSTEKAIYIRCVRYLGKRNLNKCPATAKIVLESDILVEMKSHNHDGSHSAEAVEQFKRAVKKKVSENPHLSARVIFNDESQKVPEAASQVSYRHLESTLQKIKRKVRPKNPGSIEEYVEKLQEEPELSPYFRGTIEDASGHLNGVLFSTEQLTSSLESVSNVAFDGTFFVCPRPFVQVFTLFSARGDHFFPAFVVLMKSRDEASYKNVFQKIKCLAPNFIPTFAISDFEKAARKAFKAVWPECETAGCYFHFSQCILRKIKKLGLLPLFRKSKTFKKYAQAFMAFSLLPEHDFDEVFRTLDSQVFEGLTNLENSLIREFKKYFKKTWLSDSVRHNLSVFGKPFTTNNGSETFHAQFKKHFISPKPNIWAFTSQLGKILEAYGLDLERFENGLQITRNRKKRVALNLERRAKAQEKLESGMISSMKYLYTVSHTIDSLVTRQTENENAHSDSDSDTEEAELEPLPPPESRGPCCTICTDIFHETWVFTPCGHGELCPDCNSLFTGEARPCPTDYCGL